MEFIKGASREQVLLLPECIEDYVGADSLVRVIDAFVNSLDIIGLGFARSELKDRIGRPPYDPKDLLKLYVYGYIHRIRSSRRLEAESKRNLEVIWLLNKLSPDFKTVANFRHDNSKALKGVFRSFVKLCVKLDLYGKELGAIDGSKFKAVNSRSRNYTQKQLEDRVAKLEGKIKEYLCEMDKNDVEEEAASGEKTAMEITGIVSELTAHKERYQEYIKELEEKGEKQKSLTDSESRLMLCNGKMDVSYNVQTGVDSKHKLVVDFEVSNQGNDKNLITPMTANMQEILEAERIAVVTDAGYESIQDILSAMRQGVEVHVSGTDFDICVPSEEGESREIHSHHNGRCVYIGERNIALCPMGEVLYPATHNASKDGLGVYKNTAACKQCTNKCTKNARGCFEYKIPMAKEDFTKEYNDQGLVVKQIRIKADKELVKQRKSIVEHPFGTLKRGMDAGYCLTKGLHNVRGEFSLAFLAYNIKRAINILGCGKLLAAMA